VRTSAASGDAAGRARRSARETFTWRSPLGLLGVLADKIVVERHMRAFLQAKQSGLKAIAERTASERVEAP